MRATDHCCLSDLRVGNHRALNLSCAQAVTGDIQHVIDSPGNPVVPVLIASRAVTGEIHSWKRFEIGVDEALVVSVYRSHLTGPAIPEHQIAFAGTAESLAGPIND